MKSLRFTLLLSILCITGTNLNSQNIETLVLRVVLRMVLVAEIRYSDIRLSYLG